MSETRKTIELTMGTFGALETEKNRMKAALGKEVTEDEVIRSLIDDRLLISRRQIPTDTYMDSADADKEIQEKRQKRIDELQGKKKKK